MKKFRFSLSTLLQVRKQAEEIAHKNLLEAHLLLQRQLAGLSELHQEQDKIIRELRRLQRSDPNPEKIISLNNYMQSIEAKIERQLSSVKQATFFVELQRQEVIKAMQKRKIIENLKDKRYSEWEEELFDKERADQDELSTMRYSRSKSKAS
jgi:flagellar FliJ protein